MVSFLKARAEASLLYRCLARPQALYSTDVIVDIEVENSQLKMLWYFLVWPVDSRPDFKPAKAILLEDKLFQLSSG